MAYAACMKCGQPAVVTPLKPTERDKKDNTVSYKISYPCGCGEGLSINHMKQDKSPVSNAKDIRSY